MLTLRKFLVNGLPLKSRVTPLAANNASRLANTTPNPDPEIKSNMAIPYQQQNSLFQYTSDLLAYAYAYNSSKSVTRR